MTFDQFGKATFGTKKSGSWYRRSAETIVVFNLQKSNYGRNYYINVGVWLLAAGSAIAPKPSHCHIQTRLEQLVPQSLVERLNGLLDLDNHIEEDVRHEELLEMLSQHLLAPVEAAATLCGLRSGEGMRLVQASLVDGEGQRLLAAS